MLSDLAKEVGVILFVNTSLGESNRGTFYEILNALWKHAEALRAEGRK